MHKEKIEQEKLVLLEKERELKRLEEEKKLLEEKRLEEEKAKQLEKEEKLKESQKKEKSTQDEELTKLKKNKIIISVGSEIITNYDVATEIKYLNVISRGKFKDIDITESTKIAVESLIKDKIKKNELNKYPNLVVSDERILREINRIYKNLGFDDVEDLKEYLIEEKYRFKDFRYKIILEFKWNQLIYQFYRNQIIVDKKEIDEKLKKLVTEQNREEYLISEIFVESGKQEDLNNLLNNINVSIKKNGFKNTAIKFSSSPSSQQGGRLGWITENQISKNLLEHIKNTKINEITDPIPVTGGLILIQIEDKRITKNEINVEKMMARLIENEKNRQLLQFSLNHFNQIKNNTIIKFFND